MTTKPLIIAEKKNLAMDIGNALGITTTKKGYIETSEYMITWVSGHALMQAEPSAYGAKYALSHIPIVRDKIIMIESPHARFKLPLSIIKKYMKTCEYLIHAGDPDREGQLIIDELIEFYQYKGHTKRLLISDNNKSAILDSFKNIEDNSQPNHQNRSAAALARSIIDWEVGMSMSRAMTILLGEKTPVGRVQSPVLQMIYARSELIKAFTECKYHVPVAKCSVNNQSFDAEWVSSPDTPSVDEKGRISNKQVAEDIARRCTGTGMVKSVTKTSKKVSAPLGYTLSKLYIDTGRILKMTPNDTLAICQSLYDIKKVTTYPRVNCPYLPTSFLSSLSAIIDAIGIISPDLQKFCGMIDLDYRSKIWNDKKVKEKAHYALCVTGTIKNLSTNEANVFKLIAQRILMQFMPAYAYETYTVIIEMNGCEFKFQGIKVTDQGWRVITGGVHDTWIEWMNDLQKGQSIDIAIHVDSRKTSPPKLFTPSTVTQAMCSPSQLSNDPALIKVLKRSDGLGTEATRPSFVPKLLDHSLIKMDKKKDESTSPLTPSESGIKLIQGMEKVGGSAICDPATTAAWEMMLGDIESGYMDKDDFLREQRKFIASVIDEVKNHAPKELVCPDCGSPMLQKKSRYGIYYGCSGYKDGCKTILNKDGQKHVKKSVEYGDDCPLCHGKTIKREFNKKVFFSCDAWNTGCKYSYEPDSPDCPDCASKMSGGKNGWWCRVCSI